MKTQSIKVSINQNRVASITVKDNYSSSLYTIVGIDSQEEALDLYNKGSHRVRFVGSLIYKF